MDTRLQNKTSYFKDKAKKTTCNDIELPKGYKGIAAFHKYWGKKPIECLTYLIESLTSNNELIVDPFLGYGLIAREAVLRERRFIGIDINPCAVEMSRLLIDLPSIDALSSAIVDVERKVKTQIEETYKMTDDKIATHYLWDGEHLKSVWYVKRGKGGREERVPTQFDVAIYEKYENYEARYPRPVKHFHNSRINTTANLSLNDLFTGRARYNIDLILDAIYQQPDPIRRSLLLSLTSASGQMSRMVFAITGRGKTSGIASKKIEVGSWIIGYWRPILHFEINVWNCFYKRATELLKAISNQPSTNNKPNFGEIDRVLSGAIASAIVNGDARDVLDSLPADSVSLIITDPPHGDRIPYLEMSEMWNSLLGMNVDFEREIVVSNAQGRSKTKALYTADMAKFLTSATRVIKPNRFLALLFNARDEESWQFLQQLVSTSTGLYYRGCFPMSYSANSVVQDNRKGSLKSDFVLIYQKLGVIEEKNSWLTQLECLQGWTSKFPGK